MKERNLIIAKLITSHILLPLGTAFAALFCTRDSFLLLSITQSILLILIFTGYWEFFGIKFKWIYVACIEMLLLLSVANRLFLSEIEMPTSTSFSVLLLIQVYLLWVLIKICMVIFSNDNEKIEIEFPFGPGSYLITDGGNSKISRLMNYHFHSSVHKKRNTNKSMRYATDIVKLNSDRKPFIPTTNEEYAIFGENVYCPMEGTVIKVINDIDDHKPFSGNYPYNTGNTVVIKQDNYYFLLGHLKQGSIKVEEYDSVKTGDLLGIIGNSGMSERPHLHMQLMKCNTDDYWKGLGICIQYRNKNLYKNRLIKVITQ